MRLPDNASVGKLHEIGSGKTLYRVHSEDYAGDTFNPCQGPETRFTHVRNGPGCVPSLYAATTLDGAAYETVFRGAPSKYQALARSKLDDRMISRLETTQSLNLVPLFTPELANWGISQVDLFVPHESAYPACRELASRCWRDNQDAQGLIWSSVRDSGSLAMLLFEGRIDAGVLKIHESRSVRTDQTALQDLEAAGRRAGWRISK